MKPMIVEKHPVVTYGPYAVMEGDVIFDSEHGEVTQCWVECEGKTVSRFSDIDYAMVRAAMLSQNQSTPDMDGNCIDILVRTGPFTILEANFGGNALCWVVDCGGNLRTLPSSRDDAEAWIEEKMAAEPKG